MLVNDGKDDFRGVFMEERIVTEANSYSEAIKSFSDSMERLNESAKKLLEMLEQSEQVRQQQKVS